MYGINNAYHIVNILRPQTQSGALASDHVSMRGYSHADVIYETGALGNSGTCALTLDQMTLVGTAGTTTLGFSHCYASGAKIYVTDWNGTTWTDDETVTGNTLSGSLEGFFGNYMLLFGVTVGTVADETLTGGTSNATAVAINANEYEDAMIKRDASSNSFTTSGVANETYVIPIDAASFTDGYDVFHLDCGAPSASTILMSATAVLYKPRYMSGVTEMSPIYD